MQSVPTQDQAPVPCQSKEQDVDCLHVEASDRERFVVPTTNLRIAAVLSAALVAYKAVQWLLFFGLGLNWLIVAVLAASLATYWIATLVLKHVFRGGRKGESLKIEGWVFSETMILRKFARFTEAFPVSAIGNVEERSDHVSFTYSSGDVDVVYRSEVDSDTDWAFLLKTLKAKHADYKKAFSTMPSSSEDEFTISSSYTSSEHRAYLRLSSPGDLPFWKCFLSDVKYQGVCLLVLLFLLHRPGEGFESLDTVCLLVLHLFQSVIMGQSSICKWIAARFAKAGRKRYWSLSREGLRSSEVFGVTRKAMGNSYKQITRYWSELSSIEQITEGLVFRFEGSQEPALIPRHSIPLQQWNALLSQLSQFGLKIVDK